VFTMVLSMSLDPSSLPVPPRLGKETAGFSEIGALDMYTIRYSPDFMILWFNFC